MNEQDDFRFDEDYEGKSAVTERSEVAGKQIYVGQLRTLLRGQI